MANYTELLTFIKSLKSGDAMEINGNVMKGDRLKGFLITKLSHPQSVDLSAFTPIEVKPKPKRKQSKPE